MFKQLIKSMLPSRFYKSVIFGSWTDYSKWDKRKLIEQGFERNASFYSAARLVARTVASLPIYVEIEKNGERTTAKDHPVLHGLDRQTPLQEFVEYMMLYTIVTGESYALNVKSDFNKKPLGFIVLPSQWANPIMGDVYEPIKGFRYTQITDQTFEKDEVFYYKTPNLSEYFHGMSAGVPLAELLDLNNAAITWNKNIALSGGLPPVIARVPGVTDTEKNRLQDEWKNGVGANGIHRLKILGSDVQLEKFNDKPHDAEWSQALLQSMRMIFMTLGVSSELMNDAGNKTYSNYKEARKAMYIDCAIPAAENFWKACDHSATGGGR